MCVAYTKKLESEGVIDNGYADDLSAQYIRSLKTTRWSRAPRPTTRTCSTSSTGHHMSTVLGMNLVTLVFQLSDFTRWALG